MPNKRDLRMEKYKISTNRYRELKYFCMQYREKKSRLRAITELSVSSMERSKGGNKTSDRTADIAMQRLQLENDIQMIETAAIEADSALYSYDETANSLIFQGFMRNAHVSFHLG